MKDAEGKIIYVEVVKGGTAASKVFEQQFDEMNKKVADAKKELEIEKLKRAEETVQFE